jgi:hypothetical protein
MLEFEILGEVTLPAEPDILLFSLLYPSILVVGTYHLKQDATREGLLLTYQCNPVNFSA